MDALAEDLLIAVERSENTRRLFSKFHAAARQLEFDHCAYGLQLAQPQGERRILMLSSYPLAWDRRYREAHYVAVDPIVLHGQRSQAPIAWSDALFAQAPALWEERRSFGLQAGWAQANHDGDGNGGLLSLTRSGPALHPKELQAKESAMCWLASITHLALSQGVSPRRDSHGKALLTPREIEILKWTAEGKSAQEISRILCISTATVNFHARNTAAKFKVPNKTAAVARAALLGLLG